MLIYEIKDKNYSSIKEIAKSHFQISDRLLTKLKKNNHIFLNDKNVYINENINIGDVLKFDIDFNEESENILPLNKKLDIIFEDEYLLIVNKPYGIPVHPSILHYEDSLSNIVKYYFEKNNINKKIRPVNRLDKDTSGIVVFAKNEYVQEYLVREMKNNIFCKEYFGILTGHLLENEGIIKAPISRKKDSIIEREINENGDVSITHFKLIKNFVCNNEKLCLVLFKLETGRTHQIRVHSKYIGHPILR